MKEYPSAEALALAVKLSGHTSCQLAVAGKVDVQSGCFYKSNPCDGCLGDAATIDGELKRKERNAALAAAQGVVDIYDMLAEHKTKLPIHLNDAFNELRDALAAIKSG